MKSEFISFGDSLVLSGVGFLIVFMALAALAVFIILLAKSINKKKAPALETSNPAPQKPVPAAPVIAPSPAPVLGKVALPATTSMGSCDLHNVSERDAALIMAIVADKLNAPLNTLLFKSIKEVK